VNSREMSLGKSRNQSMNSSRLDRALSSIRAVFQAENTQSFPRGLSDAVHPDAKPDAVKIKFLAN